MKILTIAIALALCAVPFSAVLADEPVSDREVVVPPPRTAPAVIAVEEEKVVSAAPPPFVSLKSTSVAAGIGLHWGGGTITYEGRDHAFDMKGLSLGDLGATRSVAVGEVSNLNDLADFEGQYLAVEAGAAAGPGVAKLTMRNENGVVINVRSEQTGGRLTLGAEGLRITLD